MYSIHTESLKLELEIVPVDSLLLHEEVLPQLADKLILEFRNWANLQNPIIVDDNYIVLDGNHRAYVFKKLKFKYIPVCKINYLDDTTQLRYWFRLLGKIENLDMLKPIVEGLQGTFRPVTDRETLIKAMEDNAFSCGIQHANFYVSISFGKNTVNDAVSAYDVLEKIQKELTGKGVKLKYIPCQTVLETGFCDTLKNDEIIIWTPQITKEMVIDAAKNQKKFAPKSTRHLVSARPLNVNIPTFWFQEDMSLHDINKRFLKLLKKKRVKRFGPGQVINGRYYEEELFVFFAEKESP